MLKAKGKLSVEPHNGRIVLNVSDDFVKYYSQFVEKKYWILLQQPLHRSHVTLAMSKLHKGIKWKKAVHHHGKDIEFEYDIDMLRGGYRKGFIMFYMKVYSEELDKLKDKFGIVDNSGYQGLHITIGNTKNGVRLYWPQMIEIR